MGCHLHLTHPYIYIYIYICVCVCVWSFVTFGLHKIEFVSLSTVWKLPEAPCLFKMCWDILVDWEMSITVLARISTFLWVVDNLQFATDLWWMKTSSVGMKRVGVPESHCINLSKLRRRTGHAETEEPSNRAKFLQRMVTEICVFFLKWDTPVVLYMINICGIKL